MFAIHFALTLRQRSTVAFVIGGNVIPGKSMGADRRTTRLICRLETLNHSLLPEAPGGAPAARGRAGLWSSGPGVLLTHHQPVHPMLMLLGIE